VHERAVAELRAGRKQGHWMWFVFPQLRGLGHSPTAQRYAISGLAEAQAYAADPQLGARLREAAQALLALGPEASAVDVLGPIDAMKLRSCATLFARATPEEPAFTALLERFYAGAPDEATLRLLAAAPG
jgi:uncharacterized protein (DUF1810 family)